MRYYLIQITFLKSFEKYRFLYDITLIQEKYEIPKCLLTFLWKIMQIRCSVQQIFSWR